ncbi:class I SAM-dependent methyltransferase [Robiginitalea aurantiaca]|uniref:Class I SAM-dependent methyltransferase n=1 Tax=Robiginitalea aurantiaca TaxID=3056915 RepID=A0ABT7WDZ3_9FLAO|nr:class I SAM-dependent methyltransferase [Robiginitalea aurantiaca]MDM9631141.1 class I SAM-dependent methyltransferase [Robiginitalea aurantiaca]
MKNENNPAGNFYDKYGTANPIAKALMNGFLKSFDDLVKKANAKSIYEIGCGEGHLAIRMAENGGIVKGSDISSEIIQEAKKNNQLMKLNIDFQVQSVYNLTKKDVANPDLIVCCEVLEHLDNPNMALEIIKSLNSKYLIVSVPREPIWRILNVARGKYWKDLGNTPGHLQHWSKKSFLHILKPHFAICEIRSPFPWTMVLCENLERS